MEALPEGHPLADDIASFDLWLRAAGKSAKTRRIYTEAAAWLGWEAIADPAVNAWPDVTRGHVRQHMANLTGKHSPAYASNQFRALQQFWRFLAEEYDMPSVMGRDEAAGRAIQGGARHSRR